MGSYVSFLNDTDDVIMVKLTANTKVFLPIITGVAFVGAAALTAVTAGAAAPLLTIGGVAISGAAAGAGTAAVLSGAALLATRTAVNDAESALASGYARDGYIKVQPGKTWKAGKQTLSLNQRMWLIRLDKDKGGTALSVRTADSSIWTGATANSINQYRASDMNYFRFKTVDISRGGAQVSRGGAQAAKPATAMRGGAIEVNGGNSRLAGLVTGLLLASPLNSPGFVAMNKHHSRPIGRDSSFGANIGNLLGNGL